MVVTPIWSLILLSDWESSSDLLTGNGEQLLLHFCFNILLDLGSRGVPPKGVPGIDFNFDITKYLWESGFPWSRFALLVSCLCLFVVFFSCVFLYDRPRRGESVMEVSLCDLLDWISFLTPLTRESVRRQFDSWHFFILF